MELNFNACLTLLIIAFVMALICIRCLMGVVNRCFSVIDYAKAQLIGKTGSGSVGVKDLIGIAITAAKPMIEQKIQGLLGVKPQ
jgi:hypothetical protein